MRACGLQIWHFVLALQIICPLAESSPPKKIPPPPPIPYLIGFEPEGESFYQSAEYNEGAYGLYVNRTFKSAPGIVAPRLNFERPFTDCDDGSYIFVTPRGEEAQSTPYILDASGSLVWTPDRRYGQVYNFQVVEFKGEPYVAFWAGNDSVGGHGAGKYYMFDKHYRPFRTLDASNGLTADLHSFTILPGGTVLCTSYDMVDLTKRNLQPYHRQSWVWDSLFQEFDLETGELIFQWRASDHFLLEESYSTRPFNATHGNPWDWFHINMVEKDADGNYLASSRHLRCIFYVSGETGEVLWRLGGKFNQFADLTPPHGTFFVGQHDVHWDEDRKFITMFDNRADWEFEFEHVSRGIRLEVDLDLMTVAVNTTFDHPQHIFAFSQGSYQTLPNGNVLIGYGYTAALTEFSPNGTVLCDAYLQPSGRFSSGDVQSYRNLKFPWTGLPKTKPNLVLDGDILYVSWLGSTEVTSWLVQDSVSSKDSFGAVMTVPKTGFETQIPLAEHALLRRYVRVVALDQNRKMLATSLAINIGDDATSVALLAVADSAAAAPEESIEDMDYEDALQQESDLAYLELIMGLTVLVAVVVLALFWSSIGPRMFSSLGRTWTIAHEKPAHTNVTRVWWHLLRPRWRGLRIVRRIWLGSQEYLPLEDGSLYSDVDRGSLG